MPSCRLSPVQSCDILMLILYFQASKAALVSRNTELYDALCYHVVNKRLLTKDLKNDMILQSINDNHDLYINHYSNGVCFSFLQIDCV